MFGNKGYYERYALNVLKMVYDEKYKYLLHTENDAPDWKGTINFNCGLEVTRAISSEQGANQRFAQNCFDRGLSYGELKKLIKNYPKVSIKLNETSGFSWFCEERDKQVQISQVIGSINNKLNKLNKNTNYSIYESNELFLFLETGLLKYDDILCIIDGVDSKYKRQYDKIFMMGEDSLYVTIKRNISKICLTDFQLLELKTQSNPND
ncbi:MAG: hypothetical protein RR585_12715 [Coprobacillus sp.]